MALEIRRERGAVASRPTYGPTRVRSGSSSASSAGMRNQAGWKPADSSLPCCACPFMITTQVDAACQVACCPYGCQREVASALGIETIVAATQVPHLAVRPAAS